MTKRKRSPPRGDQSRLGKRVGTSAKEIRKAETKNQILELRIAGASVRQIAKQLGRPGHGYVHALLVAAISEIPEENARQAKTLELERLDALWRAAYPLAVGLPVVDDKGNVVRKRDPDIAAQRQCIRITAQRAKFRGLYAQQVEKHLHAFTGADDFEKWTPEDMQAFATTGKLPAHSAEPDE